MRFEEVLPALREGKKIRRKEWSSEKYIIRIHNNTNSFEDHNTNILDLLYFNNILSEDWEIVEEKKKVKYYPILIKNYFFDYNNTIYYTYKIHHEYFKNIDDALYYVKNNKSTYEYREGFIKHEVVRLIIEVPELIEERES